MASIEVFRLLLLLMLCTLSIMRYNVLPPVSPDRADQYRFWITICSDKITNPCLRLTDIFWRCYDLYDNWTLNFFVLRRILRL